MNSNITYKTNGTAFFKINSELKRITKIENNKVEYLDYDTNISLILSYKKISMSLWKKAENNFFISRHFEWEYEGNKYVTCDGNIEWRDDRAIVFHNGKIWQAYFSGNYYPRILLTRTYQGESIQKWTDAKYCRKFKIVERYSKIKKLLDEN